MPKLRQPEPLSQTEPDFQFLDNPHDISVCGRSPLNHDPESQLIAILDWLYGGDGVLRIAGRRLAFFAGCFDHFGTGILLSQTFDQSGK